MSIFVTTAVSLVVLAIIIIVVVALLYLIATRDVSVVRIGLG